MDNNDIIEKLQQNENRFRAIVEHCTDAVAVLSPEGKVLYTTPSIKNVLGYTGGEAEKLDFFSLVHPDDRGGLSKVWEKVLTTKGISMPGHTARMKHSGGNWRWVESSVKNMIHDPAVNGIINSFRDVTERVKVEKQKVFDKNNLEALINSTNDFMWSVDHDFKIITAKNPLV
jgi:PAS domain S-box-containing protein